MMQIKPSCLSKLPKYENIPKEANPVESKLNTV